MLQVATCGMYCRLRNSANTKTKLTREERSWHLDLDSIALQADFVVSRHNVQPTSIGRKPPSFFERAHSEAPQKTGWMVTGTRPDRQRLTNSVRCDSSLTPASPVKVLVMSFRCCDRNPSRPPADPGRNDLYRVLHVVTAERETRVDGRWLRCAIVTIALSCTIFKLFDVE